MRRRSSVGPPGLQFYFARSRGCGLAALRPCPWLPYFAPSALGCYSEPPIKARVDLLGVMNPVNAESSGTCTFNVPASQLPHLGELTIQVTITPVALQISFRKDSNLLGVYAAPAVSQAKSAVGSGNS